MIAKLKHNWNESSAWKKFILVNLIIPWTPIILLSVAVLSPPDVAFMVEENGKLVGSVVGESWKLASFFFAQFVAGI